jgi:hypothetical protein
MSRVGDWWRRLLGRPAKPTASSRPATPRRSPAAAPKTPAPAEPGELTLAEGPPARKKPRVGAAGFDPYSTDGGYAKPGGWDRVDHD